jgi:O-antigen ligase
MAPSRTVDVMSTVRERRLGLPEYVLLALWIVLVSDFPWLFAAYGLTPVLKLLPLLLVSVMLILVFQLPVRLAWQKKFQWYAPFLLFIVSTAVTVPWALNQGYARDAAQMYLLFWVFMIATLVMVDSPRRAELLVCLFGASFIWWAIWGAWRGSVPWHHGMSNHDGFGALMVMGVGSCAFLTAAAPKWTRFRFAMLVTSALCMIGVIASFARGAFLAAATVAVIVWLRSEKKGRGFLIGVVAIALVITASNILHPGEFWAEIQSAFSDGTDQGTNQDRWILWGAGWEVFKERPLFGVGSRNFGPFAAQFFNVGDLPQGGYGYTNNPGMLYNRSLHNVYVQILCEQGIVGSIAFLWILAHFWRRNAALRSREADKLWRARGGQYRIRMLALGLEAAMVGFLIPSLFYGLITMPWLYTVLALNLLLHSMVFGRKGRQPDRRRRRPAPAQSMTPAIAASRR